MAEIINLMDAATKQLMKHDPAFNDKAETVLAMSNVSAYGSK